MNQQDKSYIPKPIKKGRIHKILDRLIKRTGFTPKIVVNDIINNPNLKNTKVVDKSSLKEKTADIRDLREKDILNLLKDVDIFKISKTHSSDRADNVGWHMLTSGLKYNKFKHILGSPDRASFDTHYEKNFKSKWNFNLDNMRYSIFMLELHREILKVNNIKMGSKALKEKKFNVISQGPI